jgi:hypothetical protein
MRDNAEGRSTADVRPALAWRDRLGSQFHLATGRWRNAKADHQLDLL